jgi:hypothetical protein
VINAIKFSIEEIEASDQYFDHTGCKVEAEDAVSLADRGSRAWQIRVRRRSLRRLNGRSAAEKEDR